MPANVYTTAQAVGNREDLVDKVYRTSPTDTPFVSRIARVDATAVTHEWQRDKLRDPNKGNAAKEGADATFALQTPTERLRNTCQIFTDTFSISGTQNAVDHAGGPEMSRLKAKKSVELKKDVEASAIANTIAVTVEGATGRQMRGLAGWIATNNDMGPAGVAPDPINNIPPTDATATRAFSEPQLQAAILGAYNHGGDIKFCIMAPQYKQKASAFTGNVQRVDNVDDDTRATLNTAYTFYGSDFGVIEMVPDRVMANGLDNNVYGIDPDYWAVATLRGFQAIPLAKTGDAENWQMLTECTLEAREERSSFAIRDLNP